MMPARPITLLPLLAALAGCASAKVESVVDRSRTYAVGDVTVLITGPKEALSKDLGERVVERLGVRGVHAGVWVIPESRPGRPSLEERKEPSPFEKAVQDAPRPYVLMVVMPKVQVEVDGLGSSRAFGLDLELAMFSKQAEKVIWKSTVSATKPRNGWGGEGALLNEIADKVVLQLALDGLVGPVTAPSRAAASADEG